MMIRVASATAPGVIRARVDTTIGTRRAKIKKACRPFVIALFELLLQSVTVCIERVLCYDMIQIVKFALRRM